LVRKIAAPKEAYQCEKCGNTYPVMEEALRCESSPVTPFEYEIGDTVSFGMVIRGAHSPIVLKGMVERRWINGLSRDDDKPTHGNVYKVRTVGTNKGLIACRFEDDIIGKV